MTKRTIEFRKKREIGEVISDSFEFLKQEYKPISKLIFRYVLPFLILYGIVQVYFQTKIFGSIDLSNPELLMDNIGPFYLNILLFSLFGIFVQSLLLGVFYSYLDIYIKKGKGNFEITEITPVLFSNGLIILGASLVWFIITMIGIMMCLVPGIYFANTFSLVLFIVLFERQGLSNAISRSWNLVNKQWWNTLLLNVVGLFIIWVTSLFLTLPASIAGLTTAFSKLQGTGSIDYPNWFMALNIFATVITSLLMIIPATFLAFQYFNINERTKPEA